MPFELGRPLGIPGDVEFQTRVLSACLRLLEAPGGPLIEDFPEDAPAAGHGDDVQACPINFARPQAALTGIEAIAAALLEEIERLQPWYDRHVNEQGRTTFGSSGLSIETIARTVADMFGDPLPPSPNADLSLAESLRLAVEDMKAFYTEALMAQPGTSPNDALVRWFWEDTAAGRILLDLKDVCLRSDNEGLRLLGNVFLVPRAQVDRSAG